MIDIGGTNKKGELIVWQRPRILCTLESRAVAELESSEWPIENEDSIEDRQCPSDNSTSKSWQAEQEAGGGGELDQVEIEHLCFKCNGNLKRSCLRSFLKSGFC